MEQDHPPGRRPGRNLVIVAGIIAFVVVSIFVGYNLFHARTMQQEKSRSLD